MNRRALAGILVSLAVFLLFSEIGAVVLFAVQHGQFFYTRSTSTEPRATTPAAVTNLRIAPYFGFMWAPGIEASQILTFARLRHMAAPVEAPAWFHTRTNNYGFLSPWDYPFAPTDPKAVVIGIFGGSVAQWFALQGSAPLADALRASATYRDRDIVVMSFASAGYKQPQQMLVLDYFFVRGQRLDYVVNIDGF